MLAHTDHEKVESAREFVEFRAIFRYFFRGNAAVRNVYVFFLDVYCVQQRSVENLVTALRRFPAVWIIFIDREYFHVFERYLAFFIQLCEACIEGCRCLSGRKAELEVSIFA